MQINSVGYNNYGYSNQKAQKNNQQSFGMAVGKSLRAELARKGTALRALGAENIAVLQNNLSSLNTNPLTAEFLFPYGTFIRDGNKAYVIKGAPRDNAVGLVADIQDYAFKASNYAELKTKADKLPEAEAKLVEAKKALSKHDEEFADKLVDGEFSDNSISLEVNSIGKDLDLAVANAEDDIVKAKLAQAKLNNEFFNRTLDESEVALLEGKAASTTPQELDESCVSTCVDELAGVIEQANK